jgi:hypothetical protein
MDSKILAKFLSQKLNVDETTTLTAVRDFYSKAEQKFTNKNAKAYYEEHGSPENLTATGNGGKITINDVKRAIGENPSGKIPSEFSSIHAKNLSVKYGYESTDFSDNERTGRTLKSVLLSGCEKTIAIEDVKRKMLDDGKESKKIEGDFFSSEGVAKLATDNGLSPTDFEHVRGRKIKKDDVKELLEKRETAAEGNSDE